MCFSATASFIAAGFTGIIGMEFDNSLPGIEGEQAVIDAMRAIDPQ